MNPNDFISTRDDAQDLRHIDQLVEAGLSRHRATHVIDRLNAVLNGPWAETIKALSQPDLNNLDPEISLTQTCLIAYVSQWANERMDAAAFGQIAALSMLTALDAQSKDTI